MRRYYFDRVEDGQFLPDCAGNDCADEAAALELALLRIRSAVRRAVRAGGVPVSGFVTIRLACGERLMFVPYDRAIGG